MHYPFLDLPNVIGSPHNSGVTKDSVFEAAKTAIRNIKNYLEEKEPKGVVKREDYL
jgi:glycerate dehydrogenase